MAKEAQAGRDHRQSCVKGDRCWRRAERWRMHAGGSASSRAGTVGAKEYGGLKMDPGPADERAGEGKTPAFGGRYRTQRWTS